MNRTAAIIPGETRLLDYLRHLDRVCKPGELVVKEGFRTLPPAALLEALPAELLRKGVIVDCRADNGVQHLRVLVRSWFKRFEKDLCICWSSDRRGWARVDGQLHYFVNRNRLAKPPAGPASILISMCRQQSFQNHEPLAESPGSTSDVCETCRSHLPQ